MRPPNQLTKALPLFLGIGTGILLGLPRALPQLAPLQIVGFAAFFLLAHRCRRLREGVGLGALAGLIAAISALLLVRVHATAALALLLSIALNYALFGGLLLWLLRRGALAAFVAGAGLITLGEWSIATFVPLFGSAQYTTCPWSDWPMLARHEAVLGSGGTLWLVALLGASLAGLGLRPHRKQAGLLSLLTCALGLGLNGVGRASVTPAGSARVAAVVGPAFMASPSEVEAGYADSIESAIKQGASVMVLPELALISDNPSNDLLYFSALAKRHHLTFVIGTWTRNINQAVIIDSKGRLLATHTKTHWVPFMEHYAKQGDGSPTVAQLPNGPRLGLMICQDDNFTDLANATARAGAQMFTVPTLDWSGVELAHFTNARHRALETGVGLVRAAHGGIAAIFAPDGTVLAKRNHLTQGNGVIVADLPLAGAPTPFVKWGNGPLLVLAGFSVVGGWVMGRKHAQRLQRCAQ